MTVACVLAAAPLVVAHAAGDAQDDKAYRWVDKNKQRQYGDTVPPEYAKEGRVILNKHGVEVGRIEAQRSAEDAERELKRREEQERNRQHDQFLLTTYTSVKDIEQLRDVRVSQLEGQITAAQTYLDSVDVRLRVLQERAGTFKPYSGDKNARRMPDQLAEDLVRTLSEGRSQRDLLTAKRKEQLSLRDQFQTDIDRFRTLLAERSAAASAAAR